MAEEVEEPTLPAAAHQPQPEAHSIHPPSPSPSEPEESILETSTSRTPSQRPAEDISTSVSTSAVPTLANNPDYLALQSSLSLLNAQHRQAMEDMQTLVVLKEKALANPAWFRHLVETGELGKIVPQRQNVVRCPRVEWEKYGSMGMRLGRELDKPTPVDPLFTVYSWVMRLIIRVCNYFLHWNIKMKDHCKSMKFEIIPGGIRIPGRFGSRIALSEWCQIVAIRRRQSIVLRMQVQKSIMRQYNGYRRFKT
jgi:hypothetical protein